MIRGRLSDLAGPLSGRITGPDVAFTGCGTDSRTLGAGELFLALSGPHHDGHEFVAEAQERGAAAAVVERPIAASLPLLVVPDTLAALGSLAALWRARFPIPLVAVTGSNGKTTVKEMLLSILSRAGATAATRGNLNNEIGVPLCLFALDDTHRYAVMEMGANHPGEIARLCRIAEPTVAVVTCCAPAHLEGFGSVEGVARAKGEIFAGLGPDGVAVINQDDDFAPLWHSLAGERRRIGFGLRPGAEVTARLAPIMRRWALRQPIPAGDAEGGGDRTPAVTRDAQRAERLCCRGLCRGPGGLDRAHGRRARIGAGGARATHGL